MEKKLKCYRQGELCFIQVSVPEKFRNEIVEKVISNNVIREGEVTGHMHRASDNASLFEIKSGGMRNNFWKDGERFNLPQGQMFLTAKDTIEIRHDEHKTLKLDAGDYVIRIQREYDEEKDRLIAD
jgi:hypothetical protein